MFSRKLVKYDDWSRLAIHVALDNTIIVDDISKLYCRFHSHGLNIFL